MEKDCVINPATGRAVMANSRLGKQILEARRKNPQAPTQPPPANKRPTVKPKKPTEPKGSPPANKRPTVKSKKPTEPKGSPPANKRPTVKPKIPTEPKGSPPANKRPTIKPKIPTETKEPNQQYSKPIGPVKLDTGGGVKRKFDADYIKRYAKHIYDKYPAEGLRKALEKAKNGDEVKDFYADYTAGRSKKMVSLGIIVDENLTKEEQKKLFKEDKLVVKMYYRDSEELRGIKQDYLFKFEDPAE